MRRGAFITLEGGEGSGKSTQARLLAESLRRAERDVVLTREPGGSPNAERIRGLLVEGAQDAWTPHAELLLFTAARAEHWRSTIRPALERGAIVICDRFLDSTIAYQGAGHGLCPAYIRMLTRQAIGITAPDLTFWLDIDPRQGLERAGQRGGGEARFEGLDIAFHERIHAAFADIASADPHRVRRIDAQFPHQEIRGEIFSYVTTFLGLLP